MLLQADKNKSPVKLYKERTKEKREDWNYTQERRKICARFYLTLVIGAFVLCVLVDFQIINAPDSELTRFFVGLVKPTKLDGLPDVFNTIWGTAITITIFMLEISNQYRYGISLKTIIRLSLGRKIIFVGAASYLGLCPIIYFCIKENMVWSAVCCVGVAIFSFGVSLYFSARIFKTQSVQQLLRDITRKQLKFKRSVSDTAADNIHSMIDRFPITDFIIHIDYINAEETYCLTDILAGVLGDAGLKEKEIAVNEMNVTLAMTWVKHIVYNSGVDTEEEKSRTLRILAELWRKINPIDTAPLIVQFAIPFIEMKNHTGNEMLARMLNTTGNYEREIIIYLLLYTEYRYWFEDNSIAYWFSWNEPHLCESINAVLNGDIKWNEEFGWSLWRAWRMYNNYDGQMGLEQFFIFDQDIAMLQKKKKYAVQSPVFIALVEDKMDETV